MKRKTLFASMLLALLLVGCAPVASSSSNDGSSSSSESSSQLVPVPIKKDNFNLFETQQAQIEVFCDAYSFLVADSTIVSVSETGVITALKVGQTTITVSADNYLDATINVNVASLGAIKGNYVGQAGNVSVGIDALVINDKPYYLDDYRTIVNEDGEDVFTVRYTNSFTTYDVYLEGETSLVLRIDEVIEGLEGGNNFVGTFMPTIEQFSGFYSYIGDDDIYNSCFFLGNYYNPYYDSFDLGFYAYSMGDVRQDIYYIKSFKTVVNNEYVTAIEIFDYADNYSYHKLTAKQSGEQTVLYDYEYEMETLFPDVTFLNGGFLADPYTYFGYGTLDTSNNTVEFFEGSYAYHKKSDENGNYVILSNEDETLEIRPTPYGLYVINEGENTNVEYVTDHLSFIEDVNLSGNGNDIFYGFSLDTFDYFLTINGQNEPFEKVVHNHTLSLKAGDIYIVPFKDGVSALVDSEEDYFVVNTDLVEEAYVGSFFNGGVNLHIDEDFKISYIRGEELVIDQSAAQINYDPTLEYPYLSVVNHNDVMFEFGIFDENTGAYYLNSGDSQSYFYNLDYFNEYVFGDYAEKTTTNLSINLTTFTLDGQNSDYTLVPHYVVSSFAYFLTLESELISEDEVVIIQDNYISIATNDGQYPIQRSFIPSEKAASLVGKYSFKGTYGVETFELRSDGKFFADTLVDGELVNIEYDYFLMMSTFNGEKTPCIVFMTGTMNVYLYFSDNALVAMDTRYVKEELFLSEGIYVSESGDEIVYINNGYVHVNGEKVEYDIVSYKDGVLVLSANNLTISVTNKDGAKSLAVENNGVTTAYSYVEFDYEAVLGTHTVNTTTYTLSVKTNPLTGVFAGYTCSDGFLTVSEYTFVIHNGMIAMKFNFGISEVVFYVSAGVGVCEVIGGAVPPPPPPPPPPAL